MGAVDPSKPVDYKAEPDASGEPGARGKPPVLAGKREVSIVRTRGPKGSKLSLVDDSQQLEEVKGNKFRYLFVFTPLGQDRYLIKALLQADGHPASDLPLCLQEVDGDQFSLASVVGETCDAKDRKQWFTVSSSDGGKSYAIARDEHYLQFSDNSGEMFLEVVSDSPLEDRYRFVDEGPARADPFN
jgi:hypothetical protein